MFPPSAELSTGSSGWSIVAALFCDFTQRWAGVAWIPAILRAWKVRLSGSIGVHPRYTGFRYLHSWSSIMTVIDTIHQHRSIRQYKPDPVPEDLLTEILEAGIRASSSGNMQTYSIIVTRDESLRRQLYEPHMRQSMVLGPHQQGTERNPFFKNIIDDIFEAGFDVQKNKYR